MSMGSNILLEDVAKLRMQNKRLRDEVARLRFLLKGFVDALPIKRDWLDPVLERQAKAALTPQAGKGGGNG